MDGIQGTPISTIPQQGCAAYVCTACIGMAVVVTVDTTRWESRAKQHSKGQRVKYHKAYTANCVQGSLHPVDKGLLGLNVSCS